MAQWCDRYAVDIWAYCLMPNHIHLIAVPSDKEGLRLAVGEAHRRYTRRINFSKGWRGHLWQERFFSFVMDERYLLACARYIENNPVRAELADRPEQWPWSSAAAHITGLDDKLVSVAPVLSIIRGNWSDFLSKGSSEEQDSIRRHERTGRPLGKMTDSEELNRKQPEIEKSVAASDMYRLLFMSMDFPTEELASGLLDGGFEKDAAAIFEELGFPVEDREKIRSGLIACKGNEKNSNQLLTEMRREYTRLFTHPKKPAVALYETTFRYDPEDALQSKPALFISPAARDAERCYKKAGLVMSGEVNEPADHIATQMEFMMYLYLQKAKSIRAGSHADLGIIEDQIREFIQAHLQKWAKDFFGQCVSASQIHAYKAIGEMGRICMERMLVAE